MKRVFIVLLIFSVFIQCKNEKEYNITKGQVGNITRKTTKEEIIELFKNDSLVMNPSDKSFVNEFTVYSKDGKQLLSIFPKIPADSSGYLERVHVYAPNYKTEKGITVASTYQDVAANYSFDKIDPTFTSAIIYIDEINGTIVLHKSDLGLAEDDLNKIEKEQIPDLARIKYISVWFE